MSMFRSPWRKRAAVLGASALAAALINWVPLTHAAFAAPASPVVDDFEGTVPFSTGNPGIFPFGNDATSTPVLTQVTAGDRPGADSSNHGLNVPYTVSQYGGFTHDLPAAQDWSSYGAFGFWVKGTGSGQRIEFEIKDGGSDGEHSELWQAFFTDDVTGWRQIQEPFADFVRRTDYQPSGAPTDGHLDLTAMWGYAINLAGNSSGDFVFDQFALSGSAVARVGVDKDVYAT